MRRFATIVLVGALSIVAPCVGAVPLPTLPPWLIPPPTVAEVDERLATVLIRRQGVTAGCTASGTMTQTGNIDDYWSTGSIADPNESPPTNHPRQRVQNASSITICRVDTCLGQPGNSGNAFFQVWNDALTAQLGGNSDNINTGTFTQALTTSAGGTCGTTNNGMPVAVTWASNKPNPTADFWIVLRQGGASFPVRWGSTCPPTGSPPCDGSAYDMTTYNGKKGGNDTTDDFYFTVYTE
jgi:hypothetical protein